MDVDSTWNNNNSFSIHLDDFNNTEEDFAEIICNLTNNQIYSKMNEDICQIDNLDSLNSIEIYINISLSHIYKMCCCSHKEVVQWDIVRVLSLYYTPIMILFGLLGNVLSCIVFTNTRLKMRSSSFYLTALAITDITYVLIIFLLWLDLLGFYTYNANVLCQVSEV